ncbi:MAG: hypothetical protein ACRCTR_07445 [Actinomycetota bacterium]
MSRRETKYRAPWRHVGEVLVTASSAALCVRAIGPLMRKRPPGGVARWERSNYRGHTVSLLGGPVWVTGVLAAVFIAPGLNRRQRVAVVLGTSAASAVGLYDDLSGDRTYRGFHGHLGALRRGKVTSGVAKIAVLSTAGATTAGLLYSGQDDRQLWRRLANAMVSGAVLAGSANMVNLLDVRPGRAVKVVLVVAPTMVGAGPAAVPAAALIGSSLASWSDDVGERTMLGDAGANAAGMLLGIAAVMRLSKPQQLFVLGGLVALTRLSERVSFTGVIERTPVLRFLDQWGRRDNEPVS